MIHFVSWMPLAPHLPRKRRPESGTGGRPRESVRRHGADRAAEASDRETGASGLRAAVGALGAADRSTGAHLEELEASATEDELAAEKAVARDDDGRGIYAQAPRAQYVPRPSSARARGDRTRRRHASAAGAIACASSART